MPRNRDFEVTVKTNNRVVRDSVQASDRRAAKEIAEARYGHLNRNDVQITSG